MAVPEKKMYVAVPEDFAHGKSIISWALKNIPKDETIVILHVHVPPQMIPFQYFDGLRHNTELNPQLVRGYRQHKREEAMKNLNHYVKRCRKQQVKCKLEVEVNDVVVEGLKDAISRLGIAKLVMGAADDRFYSQCVKERSPTSKKALDLIENADPSCEIWFVCKEQIIWIRDKEQPQQPMPPMELDSVLSLSELPEVTPNSNVRGSTHKIWEGGFRKVYQVWTKVMELLWKMVCSLVSSDHLSSSSSNTDKGRIPSYFICPISQDVMRDPHVAADGFTYEAEAIRDWLQRGHDTSPMTNLKLEHTELTPNKALRSAIFEWLQQQQQQQP